MTEAKRDWFIIKDEKKAQNTEKNKGNVSKEFTIVGFVCNGKTNYIGKRDIVLSFAERGDENAYSPEIWYIILSRKALCTSRRYFLKIDLVSLVFNVLVISEPIFGIV